MNKDDSIKCPHCANEDTTLMEVVGLSKDKEKQYVLCDVCSKFFWIPIEYSLVKPFGY